MGHSKIVTPDFRKQILIVLLTYTKNISLVKIVPGIVGLKSGSLPKASERLYHRIKCIIKVK